MTIELGQCSKCGNKGRWFKERGRAYCLCFDCFHKNDFAIDLESLKKEFYLDLETYFNKFPKSAEIVAAHLNDVDNEEYKIEMERAMAVLSYNQMRLKNIADMSRHIRKLYYEEKD